MSQQSILSEKADAWLYHRGRRWVLYALDWRAVGRSCGKALGDHITIEADERPLVAFMLAMLVAGIASAVFVSGTPFWVILGGVLGYFGSRIADASKKIMAERDATE